MSKRRTERAVPCENQCGHDDAAAHRLSEPDDESDAEQNTERQFRRLREHRGARCEAR